MAVYMFTRYDWVITDLTELLRRRHQERLKHNSLVSNTTTLHVNHAFFVDFFTVLAQLRRDMTNFRKVELRTTTSRR